METKPHTRPGKRRFRTLVLTCLAGGFAIALCLGVFKLATPVGVSAHDTGPDAHSIASSDSTIPAEDPMSDAAGIETSQSPAEAPTTYASLSPAEYDSNVVIVSVNDNRDIETAQAYVETLSSVSNVSINADGLPAGYITLGYDGNLSSGELADQLQAQGITAQPNFFYYALDLEESVGAAAKEETPSSGVEEHGADAVHPDDKSESRQSATEEAPENTLSGEDAISGDEEAPLVAQATSINDPNASLQWALQAIHARDAWDIAKCQASSGATRRACVAIIDSGCNVNHPDLKNNIVGTYNTRTGSRDVTDTQDHGTPVAGIIAAEANNGTGVAGVSYNAGLYIVQALHYDGGEYVAQSTDIIKAYRNIMDNKVVNRATGERIRIVNMSLGSKRSGSLGTNDTAVIEVIDEAYTKHDILTVSAAGNRDDTIPYICYPCDFSDSIIGVINLEQNLVRSTSSNYNTSGSMGKELSAPGTNIYTTSASGRYGYKSGTSMSTPYVAGVAALVIAANPSLDARELKSVLCSAADDLGSPGFDADYGYGIINACAAVELAARGSFITGPDSVPVGSTTSMSCTGASGWSSSDTRVASVNSNGIVAGHKVGYASISAMVNGRAIKKTVRVYGQAVPEPTPSPSSVSMHRLYNPNSGEHFYTASVYERDSLRRAGWRYEGVGWTAPSSSASPVYRLYSGTDHHYTMSAAERDMLRGAGWSYEGIGWYSDDAKGVPLYRQFNPNVNPSAARNNSGSHNYTTSIAEHNHLISVGWRGEGIGWYGVR